MSLDYINFDETIPQMIASKAIELISTFSEAEFKDFSLFVASPYFNKESVQVKFYEILKKYYPDFTKRSFDKEKVFAKLYPRKKYNDGIMRNILSNMLELAENFVAFRNVTSSPFSLSLALMKEHTERKMEKLFERAQTRAEEMLNQRAVKDEYYYYDSCLFTYEKRNNIMSRKSSLYGSDILLPEMSHKLTIYFIIDILKNGTYIANSNHMMLKLDSNLSILNDIEAYLEREAEKYKDVIYIQYYYNALKLAKTEDEKYFYALRKIADTDYDKLSVVEKGDIFVILSNYCYYKINKGELKFRKDHFLIHKENIERGYYNAESSFLTHIRYQNVVITGLDAGELEWVESFIENYKNQLDSFNRENCYNFCRSLLFYNKKSYSDALDWAAKVKADDHSYKHQLKSLYLKIYYDMNDTEPFYSHIDSYRHFLMNEKQIPEITRGVISNYINYTKKLFDIKNDISEKDFDLMKITKEITENKSLINKVWLLERAGEIEKSMA